MNILQIIQRYFDTGSRVQHLAEKCDRYATAFMKHSANAPIAKNDTSFAIMSVAQIAQLKNTSLFLSTKILDFVKPFGENFSYYVPLEQKKDFVFAPKALKEDIENELLAITTLQTFLSNTSGINAPVEAIGTYFYEITVLLKTVLLQTSFIQKEDLPAQKTVESSVETESKSKGKKSKPEKDADDKQPEPASEDKDTNDNPEGGA